MEKVSFVIKVKCENPMLYISVFESDKYGFKATIYGLQRRL